jgi:hypothetical protein
MALRAALRAALTDLYFNSWRFAPANLAWAVVLIAALLIGPLTLPGLALLAVLAVPTAGLYRMAALVARGEPLALSDFLEAMRRYGLVAAGVGAAALVLGVVFVTNVGVGFAADHPLAWFIGALALWGLVGLVMFLLAFWPMFVDPNREGQTIRQRALLATLAVIGRPGRMLLFSAVVVVLLVAATVLFAALILVGVAYVAMVSARYVLPLVDALEASLPEGRRP